MNDRLTVIALCGRARSGKDTAVSLLAAHRGCVRLAFADPVKAALRDLGDDFLKELGESAIGGDGRPVTVRRAWQLVGTESREAAGAPGLWVHVALAKLFYASALHPRPRHRFAISDLRYRAEASMVAHWVRRRGGRFGVLRLTRGAAGGTAGDGGGSPAAMPAALSVAEAAHSSETELAGIRADREFANDGAVGDLAAAVIWFFDEVEGGRVGGDGMY